MIHSTVRRVLAPTIALLLALLVVGAAAALAATPVQASDRPCGGRAQQDSPRAAPNPPTAAEARRLVSLPYEAFAAASEAPDRTPGFDWTTDGCSWTPPGWKRQFEPACRLHDFGYRNLGNGLRLSRDEATRRLVDRRFLAEMRRICDDVHSGWSSAPGRAGCRAEALVMYNAVRSFNNWAG